MKFKKTKIADSHCHSNCSFDAKDSIDDLCKRAIELNLYALTITDHCEASGYKNPENSEFGDFSKLIPMSISQMKAAQEKYKTKLKLYRGIELGQPIQDLESANISLGLDDFDFVLASVHNVENEKDFFWLSYNKEYAYEILQRYFNEVLETTKWNKFDSLAHLTYPLRYIVGEQKVNIDINKFEKIIDEILLTLINNEKALEVNTSGLRQKIGEVLPNEQIIKRFKELGGKYITLGSDAHNCNDLAKGIEEGIDLIKKCGFSAYTIFEKHKPLKIDI